MSDTLDRTMPAARAAKPGNAKMAVVDLDLHPMFNSTADLYPFLAKKWIDHLEEFGAVVHQSFVGQLIYPRVYAKGLRRDAYPPEGGLAGSSVSFMAAQHLDPNNVQYGMLMPLPLEQGIRNTAFSAAFCHAINEWQVANWTSKDKRLRATIIVPVEDPADAVKEIELRAGDPSFVQVGLPSRPGRLLGSKHFWPILEAAAKADLPVVMHPNWADSDHPITTGGWPSYYIEELSSYAQGFQAHLTSLILSGMLDRHPDLRLVFVEGGFSWVPSFCWRLDRLWPRFKTEVALTLLPSDYVRRHLWITSQPIDEPLNPLHLKETFDWIGWDKLMFSSDYPHWDTDDPSYVLPFSTTVAQREAYFSKNALALYRLDP